MKAAGCSRCVTRCAGAWGTFPNVQGLECCYRVSLEFRIKIRAWCRESHCVQVLHNNFKWGLCFLVLFITNTWILLKPVWGWWYSWFFGLALNFACPLLSKKAYLACWQRRLSLLEEVWGAGGLKLFICTVPLAAVRPFWALRLLRQNLSKQRYQRVWIEGSKQGEYQTAFPLLIPWNSPGRSDDGSSHLLWSSNLSVYFGSSDNLNNTHFLFLLHTPILCVQDRVVNWTEELISI